ncbi:hypothetical protein BB561_002962 [Smittium simulii]|uniref:Uncharacterized protein n=1 Tax=Smittium simulii TaxID=133385 RepID=A0A2T9YNH7_9FUNG|nr:hypothetical protein BB561_002962 [Smittium simulii]
MAQVFYIISPTVLDTVFEAAATLKPAKPKLKLNIDGFLCSGTNTLVFSQLEHLAETYTSINKTKLYQVALDLPTLKHTANILNLTLQKKVYLYQLLKHSQLFYPSYIPKEKNTDKATLEAEETLKIKKYAFMKKNVTSNPLVANELYSHSKQNVSLEYQNNNPDYASCDNISFGNEFKQANHYIMVIINVIFSSLGFAYFVHYFSYIITADIGLRVLISLFSFFGLAAIETTLYMLSFSRSLSNSPDDD